MIDSLKLRSLCLEPLCVDITGRSRRLKLKEMSGHKSNYEVIRNSEKISIWMKYPSAFTLDTKKVELEEMIASEK